MDRLICGDVGFGKTEVAIGRRSRSPAGRQVAVLPDDDPGREHLHSSASAWRLPVGVEMLSRFDSKSEATQTIKGLDEGRWTSSSGTQAARQGREVPQSGPAGGGRGAAVRGRHKERIKNFRKSVDVLTLSATPIPRTLHMSLSGIRDMSLIDDPPEGRKPIKTYVKEYDDELVREVVLRELDRGGQIYFLHNRVESISHIAEKSPPGAQRQGRVRARPDARGRPGRVMARFDNGEFNFLVCPPSSRAAWTSPTSTRSSWTTRTDWDCPSCTNCGGVLAAPTGRAMRTCCTARTRCSRRSPKSGLSALREFSDLGSGYKVALRDLEIRGAGNLLGAEQSGTVATVGFDLYTQLLSQAINELKGEDMDSDFELPNIALPLDAFIPERYIPSEAERILMYKKLTAVRAPTTSPASRRSWRTATATRRAPSGTCSRSCACACAARRSASAASSPRSAASPSGSRAPTLPWTPPGSWPAPTCSTSSCPMSSSWRPRTPRPRC